MRKYSCALLGLLVLLVWSTPTNESYAQSADDSDYTVAPDPSPTSKIIDVSEVDYILKPNPSDITVRTNSRDRRERTALVPGIRTKEGPKHYALYGWRNIFRLLSFSCLGPIVALFLATMLWLLLILQRKRINLWRIAAAIGCVAGIITLAIFLVRGGIWTQHVMAIYFDNATDSKYDVVVNGERFRVDEKTHVYKELSWGSLRGTVEQVVDIRVFSTAPTAEEVEGVKIRVKVGRGNGDDPSQKVVYNIKYANKYVLDRKRYDMPPW